MSLHTTPSLPHPLLIDGTEIHVEGHGDETIVMVHGWPDTWRLWDPQVAALAPHFRCVRFTLPGFDIAQPRGARSLDEMMAFLLEVVEATSPGQPVVLMLHDWGCFFGYQFYMRYPQKVSRIVGVDIGDAGSRRHVRSLRLTQKAGTLAYQAWLAVAWRLGAAAPGLADRMTRWMARQLGCRSEPGLIGSQMNYPYDIAWTGSHGGYRQAMRFEPACPMLFLYGRRKPFMFHSPEWALELATRPGSAALPFDTGHWIMRSAAPRFNEVVLAWLQGREPV